MLLLCQAYFCAWLVRQGSHGLDRLCGYLLVVSQSLLICYGAPLTFAVALLAALLPSPVTIPYIGLSFQSLMSLWETKTSFWQLSPHYHLDHNSQPVLAASNAGTSPFVICDSCYCQMPSTLSWSISHMVLPKWWCLTFQTQKLTHCNPLMFALPETPTQNLHNYFMVKLKSSCNSLILEPN